jgi:hypothetical protein
MKSVFVLVMLGMLAAAGAADAQRAEGQEREGERQRRGFAVSPTIGVRGSYDFDTRDFGVGAQAQIPLTLVLRFVPSADVFFGDETTWQANADVALSLLLLRAGGGVALVDGARVGADGTEVGLNLFLGLQGLGRGALGLRPYAEARWTLLQDATPFRLAAGVNVPIPGWR